MQQHQRGLCCTLQGSFNTWRSSWGKGTFVLLVLVKPLLPTMGQLYCWCKSVLTHEGDLDLGRWYRYCKTHPLPGPNLALPAPSPSEQHTLSSTFKAQASNASKNNLLPYTSAALRKNTRLQTRKLPFKTCPASTFQARRQNPGAVM